MARIKIEDLPEEITISKDDMTRVMGGVGSMTMMAPMVPIGGPSSSLSGAGMQSMSSGQPSGQQEQDMMQLQNTLDKYSRATLIMSNIMRSMNDTRSSVIKNM